MAIEIKCTKRLKIVFEKRTCEENNPFSRVAQMPVPLRGCNTKKIKKAFDFEPGLYYLDQSKPEAVLNVLKFNSYFRFGDVLLFNFCIRARGLFSFIHS